MEKMNYTQSVSLDLLRIFAVQLVLFGHALSYFNILQADYIQNSAVVLFFILSGIVISYSLFYKVKNNPSYKFTEYFIDRFSRIYTALIPSLIFILLIDLIQIYYLHNEKYRYFNALDIKTFLGNLFMLQDFPIILMLSKLQLSDFTLTSFASGRPLWTLAIEWWLYMSFGLITFHYTKKFNKKYFFLLVLFLIVPLFNSFTGRGNSLTLFWIGGIIITIMIFKNNIKVSKSFSISFMLILSLLILMRLYIKKDAYDMVYVTLVTFFLFFYLSFSSYIQYNSNKVKRIVHVFASYAFTLYLIHYSILDFIQSFADEKNSFNLFIISIISSNILAFILAYYTEMRYKEVRSLIVGFFIKKGNIYG